MRGKKGIWLPKKELEGHIHVCAKEQMARPVNNELLNAFFAWSVPLLTVNTSGKAGAQIPQLPLGDDSSPWGR
jgi:hypothetical protein